MSEPRTPENEAEEKVLEAFEERAGMVDVGDMEGGLLRAEFLRDLFLGRVGNGKGWDPRRVMIKKAKISGRLELNYLEIRHHLCFNGCYFLEGISLLDSTIPSLSLENCFLRGSEYVFSGFDDRNALNANRLKAGYVHLVIGFIAQGTVSFFDADISGFLACSGGTFEGDLVAGNLRVRGIWMNQGFTAKGNVNLDGADISGKLVCEGNCEFRGDILAQGLKAREVIMREPFIARGNVSLEGATISGQLVCSGGIFEGGLVAEGLRAEQVHLSDGFKSKRGVILTDAVISGQLNCRAGMFEGSRIIQEEGTGSFVVQGLKAGDVFLDKGFVAECGVNMVGVSIRDLLNCAGGKFKSNLYLTDAEMKTFESDKEGWPKRGSLHLDGFHYRRLKRGAGDRAKDGLEWLDRMGDGFRPQPYEQLMAVYRRMGRPDWAREVGFNLEERRHREIKKNKNSGNSERFLWGVWYEILRVTIGYGYKPFRSLGWVLGLWLGSTLVFGGANLCGYGSFPPESAKEVKALFLGVERRFDCSEKLILPVEGCARISRDGAVVEMQIPEHYPRFVPAAYALEALFPVLSFGQLDKWHPGKTWLSGIRWVMTFLGTSLLAILALFGVGVLGPRWRSGEDGG